MDFQSHNYTLTVTDELAYTYNTCTSNNSAHAHCQPVEYKLEDSRYRPSSCYRVTCHPGNMSCLISSDGGFTSAGSGSVLIRETTCWITISDKVICLSLPSLKMNWYKPLTTLMPCISLYFSPDDKGIIIHGEGEISKITFDGNYIWCASGKDMFTGDFSICRNHIEVFDFNEEKYLINLKDGKFF